MTQSAVLGKPLYSLVETTLDLFLNSSSRVMAIGNGQHESGAKEPEDWQDSAQKEGSDPQYPAPLQHGAFSGQLPPKGEFVHPEVGLTAFARWLARSGLLSDSGCETALGAAAMTVNAERMAMAERQRMLGEMIVC